MLKFFAEKMWVAFAVQKLLTFFQQKNIRILYLESAKTVNEMTLNELVKLTTLWTTGPWTSFIMFHMRNGFASRFSPFQLEMQKEIINLSILHSQPGVHVATKAILSTYTTECFCTGSIVFVFRWSRRESYEPRVGNFANPGPGW